MTLTIRDFNDAPRERAVELLQACCGSARWTAAMLTRRPFLSVGAVLTQADDLWNSLDPGDWYEAFAHHPRIGEQQSSSPQTERASSWSANEQASVTRASAHLKDELARVNNEYEARFGHIYIVCAADKTPEELLSLAHARMQNPPAVELAVAVEEQRKIMRLRLGKLFGEIS